MIYLYSLKINFPNSLPFREVLPFSNPNLSENDILESIIKWDNNPNRKCKFNNGGSYTGTKIKIIEITEVKNIWGADEC